MSVLRDAPKDGRRSKRWFDSRWNAVLSRLPRARHVTISPGGCAMSLLGVLYLIAAALTFGVGVAHSVLGERYILIRLLRRNDLPQLFGGREFTARTIRLAWHVTTVGWWGAAALFLCMAQTPLSSAVTSRILAVVFLASALMTFVLSRGRHLAWPVFVIIGLIAVYGSRS